MSSVERITSLYVVLVVLLHLQDLIQERYNKNVEIDMLQYHIREAMTQLASIEGEYSIKVAVSWQLDSRMWVIRRLKKKFKSGFKLRWMRRRQAMCVAGYV